MKNDRDQVTNSSKFSREKVPYSLIIAIYIHIFIGWSFIFLPKLASGKLENNAYWGLIPAVLLNLPTFWMAADLARIYPDMSFAVVFVKVFGKFVGRFLGVVYLLTIILISNLSIREANLMVFSYFFRKTPFFLITVFFIAGSFYMGCKGLPSIGRLAAFMLIPPLVTIFGLELLGLVNINYMNLQPIFGGSPGKILLNGFDMAFAILPASTVPLYMGFIREPRNVLKVGLYSVGIIFPVFFLAIGGIIGVFGTSLIPTISWPVVEYFHLIDYPYLMLEQAGLFFLIAWYASHFVAITQVFFIIGHNLGNIFPAIKRNWFIAAFNILGFISANLPVNVIAMGDISVILQRIITFCFLTLTTCTWFVARQRFKKTNF